MNKKVAKLLAGFMFAGLFVTGCDKKKAEHTEANKDEHAAPAAAEANKDESAAPAAAEPAAAAEKEAHGSGH